MRISLDFQIFFWYWSKQIRVRNRDFRVAQESPLDVYPLLYSIFCSDLLILLIVE